MRHFLRLIATAVIIVAAPATTFAADALTMRLDWRLTGYQIPFYWAEAKGYYEDAALNVAIKDGSGSGSTVNLVGAGEDDIGFADYLIMATAASKGMDVTAVYGVVQKGAWAVISHTDDPIKLPEDLVGRSIATTADHKRLLDLFIATNELPADEITIRVVSGQTRNTVFDQEQVDAMFSISIGSPYDLKVRAQEGKGKDIYFMPAADFGLLTMGQGIIAGKAALTTKRDAMMRFIQATDRAFEEASDPDNFDEAVAIAVRASGSSPDRAASVLLQWQGTLEHLVTPNTEGHPIGWMSADDWASSIEILREIGGVDSGFNPDGVYTNDFIPDE